MYRGSRLLNPSIILPRFEEFLTHWSNFGRTDDISFSASLLMMMIDISFHLHAKTMGFYEFYVEVCYICKNM